MARNRKAPTPPPHIRHLLENLEDRTRPAVTVDLLGQSASNWAFEGPSGIDTGFTFSGPSYNGAAVTGDRIAGAVNAVAISRQNPDIAYAASVNGGIFKTLNFR